MELELGQQLFIRGSHSVSLTTEGMTLRKRAEEILDMVGKAKMEFMNFNKKVAGDIYIGSGETQAVRLIAKVIKNLSEKYPDIHYHLYSGNAYDVTERLDKGLLDFGILIQPTDLSKYDYISFPTKDLWGVLMPSKCELAKKNSITKSDLFGLPLICSRQAIKRYDTANQFLDWFGSDYDKMNIIASYNLVFNAALLAEQNIGYVITLDKLVETMDSNVCFRPLSPKLESGLNMVWKKNQLFSPAAKIFLEALKENINATFSENITK